MSTGIFVLMGKVAGIGGLCIGLILLLYREIIRKEFFANLTKVQSYRIISLIILLSFVFSVTGLAGWIFLQHYNKEKDSEITITEITNRGTSQDVIRIIPIDSLLSKIKSFDLHAAAPSLHLRFTSVKWGMSFPFTASEDMPIKELKSAILYHFELNEHVDVNYALFRHSGGSPRQTWAVAVNYREMADSVMERTLRQA